MANNMSQIKPMRIDNTTNTSCCHDPRPSIVPLDSKYGQLAKDGNNAAFGYTLIEFLKDLQHLHKYDNVLVMHNQNTTIAEIFYSSLNISIPTISSNDINTSSNDDGHVVMDEDDDDTLAMDEASTDGNITFIDHILNGKVNGPTTPPPPPLIWPSTPLPSLPFVVNFMRYVQVPVVQLNEWQHFYLKNQMTDHLLAIVQIDINRSGIQITLDHHTGLLQKLSLNLWRMKVAKVLFLMNAPLMKNGEIMAEYNAIAQGVVEQLFQHCWRQKLLYVAALMADYQITRKIYRYNPFPTFKMETIEMAAKGEHQEQVYPKRLMNLMGYKMNVVIGGSDPRIIAYDVNGKQFIGGFAGHFVWAFAQKYNCNIYEPLPFNPNSLLPSQDIVRAVRNGTVEWSAALTFPDIPFVGFSYPYEMINWCLMIPVEADIPGYKFFTSVFKGETYILFVGSLLLLSMALSAALYVHGYSPDILDIVCHDNCLRGLLGQSFTELPKPPKIVSALYLQICVLGILLTTAYNAYFSTYVTKSPKMPTLNNLDDIMASGLKSIAWTPEYNEIFTRAPDMKKYSTMFILENNYQKYLQLRETFNTDYGYVVPTTKWTIVHEQQKIFTTNLFRQSSSFCFYNNIPMCYPVHENSLYIESVYQLILEVYQSGLIYMWMEHGFMELIKAGKLEFSDLSKKKEFHAMKVDDLRYIFIFLAIMLVVVLVVFSLELMIFYRAKIFKKFIKCFGGIMNKNLKVNGRDCQRNGATTLPSAAVNRQHLFNSSNLQRFFKFAAELWMFGALSYTSLHSGLGMPFEGTKAHTGIFRVYIVIINTMS
ncbi:ionotropic receptor 94e [Haematobia irritans]|uniref:ionotropic receptor 94e n=1 Tax=Haematobia irritans TaxID=7368 RepID=UPI003F4F70ED